MSLGEAKNSSSQRRLGPSPPYIRLLGGLDPSLRWDDEFLLFLKVHEEHCAPHSGLPKEDDCHPVSKKIYIFLDRGVRFLLCYFPDASVVCE